MAIQSVEDANVYIANVHKYLKELRYLSQAAGLNTHAAIWLTIEAAFSSGIDEVKTISDMMLMYLEAKVAEQDRKWETENAPMPKV